jgi:hypothetical protein
MSDANQPSQAGGEHERAVQRLGAAVEERSRLRDDRDGATGTAKEVDADTSLRAADELVLARQRWLTAVDDHNH